MVFKTEDFMKKNFALRSIGVCIALLLVFGLSSEVFGQGKGKGGGKGKGNSSSTRGNSDKSKSSDDSLWDGFPDDKNKSKRSDSTNGKSQRFKGLSKKTGVSADVLQSRFEYERRLNPDLTYGQFVAANMISRNHRGISTADILGGLRDGRSIGQTLKNKGWEKGKIDKERKRIRDVYKDDKDYDDRDELWDF